MPGLLAQSVILAFRRHSEGDGQNTEASLLYNKPRSCLLAWDLQDTLHTYSTCSCRNVWTRDLLGHGFLPIPTSWQRPSAPRISEKTISCVNRFWWGNQKWLGEVKKISV